MISSFEYKGKRYAYYDDKTVNPVLAEVLIDEECDAVWNECDAKVSRVWGMRLAARRRFYKITAPAFPVLIICAIPAAVIRGRDVQLPIWVWLPLGVVGLFAGFTHLVRKAFWDHYASAIGQCLGMRPMPTLLPQRWVKEFNDLLAAEAITRLKARGELPETCERAE